MAKTRSTTAATGGSAPGGRRGSGRRRGTEALLSGPSPSRSELREKTLRWIRDLPTPPAPVATRHPVKGERLTRKKVDALRRALTSGDPFGELVGKQKLTREELVGRLHSAVTTYQYVELKADFQRRLRRARSSRGRALLRRKWGEAQLAARAAFRRGGLAVSATGLDGFAGLMRRDSAGYRAIRALVRTSLSGPSFTPGGSDGLYTGFVPGYTPRTGEAVREPTLMVFPEGPELTCESVVGEGSYSRSLPVSFPVHIQFDVWCPTWTDMQRHCTRTLSLGEVSLQVPLVIDFKVTPCGGDISARVLPVASTLKTDVAWRDFSALYDYLKEHGLDVKPGELPEVLPIISHWLPWRWYLDHLRTLERISETLPMLVVVGCTGRLADSARLGHTALGDGQCRYEFAIAVDLEYGVWGEFAHSDRLVERLEVVGPCPPEGCC